MSGLAMVALTDHEIDLLAHCLRMSIALDAGGNPHERTLLLRLEEKRRELACTTGDTCPAA
jgi:hypothetical protein